MTRLLRIGKLFKRMDDILQASAFRLIRLILVVLMIIHWTACAWMVISYSHVEESEWQTVWEQYSTCFFQAAAMLFSQGLFTTPITIKQELFSSFMTLIGAALQATAFGSVAVLLATFDEEEAHYNKWMVDIGRRMRQLDLTPKLQNKVLSYFEYLWLTTKTTSTDADAFIEQLSGPLRSEVKLNLFGDLVGQIPFLRKVSPITIEALVLKMQPKAFLQGDKVIRKGQSGNWMGFISSGELAILDPSTPAMLGDKIIRILGAGAMIGEMALLFDVDRTCDVMAVMFTRLHILTRDDFFGVRDRYPEDGLIIEKELELIQKKKDYKQSKENKAHIKEMLGEPDSPMAKIQGNKKVTTFSG
jgi:potassium voltage-gated channel Eag-related subfamily H protein 6